MRSLTNTVFGRWMPQPPLRRLYPKWRQLLKRDEELWTTALSHSKHGPHVLIATSTGGFVPGSIVESTLAVALTLRGAQVHILLCDKLLPGCFQGIIHSSNVKTYAKYGPQKQLCQRCFSTGCKIYEPLGLPVYRYSEWLTPDEHQAASKLASEITHQEIGRYELDGVAVGEHALAGAVRFFARGDLDGEPYGEQILRRYFEASLLTTYVTRRLLRAHRFNSACFHHGIYVPHGLIGEVARAENVPVINWNPAYRKQCFIFSHYDTYHHTLLDEPTSNWESLPWNSAMEAEILEYLKSRWQGTRDWIYFHENPQEDLSVIASELGIDFSKPCIGLLTNVIWDAQLHYRANAFPSLVEWVLQTIRYFGDRPELQLIIRVHPAEVRAALPSRQPIVEEIQRAIPVLPKNVFVIGPKSQVSTYAVMMECNAVTIYGTKTGVELTSMGIPTIVAGEAWIRNKGITQDASSSEEYFNFLDRLPLEARLSDHLTQRARKYAYHFFFRRMIPLSLMHPNKRFTPYSLDIESIERLLPGRDSGIDVICEGILKGKEFIYEAEKIGVK